MIWQFAQVVDSGAGSLRVRIAAPDHCQRCARGEGCGAGVFSGLFARRDTHLTLPAAASIQVGEWVRLGVPPRTLVMASVAHYGFALTGLLAGAWLGQTLGPEGFEDLSALAGGAVGLAVCVSAVARCLPVRLNPVVERLSCSGSDAKSSFNSS